ncbi:Ppx/GppA phosphatase family protein [Ilumatobacter nonamiensis]|uniref:Ppx/GppA phosphatase family protein n=1 Tax=Ilumatobacter nonamiensis TaxID=467093 RepID=UPI0006888940|nr:hypothetical protein [Ilumatobacter nonamiensis]
MNSSENPAVKFPAGVVPRWEWRVVGSRFDAADRVLDGRQSERVDTSHERYFVSARSNASVKLRGGLLDMKLRLDVDDRGLELWAPALSAEFPLSADDLATILAGLGSAMPSRPGPCSLDGLVDLSESRDDLMVVAVSKKRRHFRVDGCMVEMTDITIDGNVGRSVTIESPDATQVMDTLFRLGLGDRPNISMARGIKALLGFGSSRLAVIDVGTNSVKYHLEERDADGTSSTLADRAEVTRLGENQSDDGVLDAAAVERTVEAIRAMVTDARDLGPVDIVGIGTAGLRQAPNRSSVIDAVRDRVAVDIEAISGPEEARLAYLAATSALPTVHGNRAVFDSGGGSTQFTFGRGDRIDEQFSVDVGAVRVAEEFGLAGAVSPATLEEVLVSIASRLARLDGRTRPDGIIAIGGTATNLAAVAHGLAEYDPDVVHGTVVDLAELDRQIEMYRSRSADERRTVAGLQTARAEVILGGVCIVRAILTALGHDAMTVSDRGLRHGVVIDRFGPAATTI